MSKITGRRLSFLLLFNSDLIFIMISGIGKVDKRIIYFVTKFLFYFIVFYGLSYAVIAMAAAEGCYVSFVDKYFDYVSGLRHLLVCAAYYIVDAFGYACHVSDYTLHVNDGVGVHVGITCAGIGLISFWWAFILSFPRSLLQRCIFFITGTIAILCLNIIRITTLAIVYTRFGRFNIDHHSIFNILAYLLIFAMIIFSVDYGQKRSKSV